MALDIARTVNKTVEDTLTNDDINGLKCLNLDNNNITDITPLAVLVNLEYLVLWSNNIPAEQVEKLRIALPDCHIIWY